MRSQERFPFYAALGLTLIIAIQALVNISVALCLLPTKGLPLPLVSYGGSSLLANAIVIGLLLALSDRGAEPLPPPRPRFGRFGRFRPRARVRA